MIDLAENIHPDMVWVDKGRMVVHQTLEVLKRRFGSILIHYTPDPALTLHTSRHFEVSLPSYDHVITTKSYELDLYQQKNVKNLIFMQQSYDEKTHNPKKLTQEELRKFGSDVLFIGHWEKTREEYMTKLYESNIKLSIWGPLYRSGEKNRDFIRRCWRGDGLYLDDYAKGWSGAKIGICFLSRLIPDQTTSRSFEIPACGCFMLAERTPEHSENFKEGKEADFFSSKEELLDKCRYYLRRPKLRLKMAKAGRERCAKSGYSYQTRFQKMFKTSFKNGRY